MNRRVAASALIMTAALWGQSGSPLLTIDTIKLVQAETSSSATLETSVNGGVFNYTLTTVTATFGVRTGKGSFTIAPPAVRGSDGPTVTFDSPATFVVTQTYDPVLSVGAMVFPDIGPTCDARQFKTFNCLISRLAIENTPLGRRAYIDANVNVSIVSNSLLHLRIYFFLDAPAPVCSDVTIDHTEVVQVVQNPQNSVLLIRRKPTVARVFVKLVDAMGQPLTGVTGILRGFRDGRELDGSPLNIFGGTATARGSVQRDSIGDSLNFELPLEWTSGAGLELRPEVKVPSCGGSDQKQVTSSTVVDFINARAQGRTKLRIGWIPFCHQQPPDSFGATFSLQCPDEATIPAFDYELRKVYPLPPDDVELTQINVPRTTRLETFTADEEAQFLNSISKTYLATEGRFFDHLVAMIPLSTGLSSGRAILPGKVFYVAIKGGSNSSPDDSNSYIGYNAQTLAHELGHNLKRLHTGGLLCTFDGSIETSKAYTGIQTIFNQWPYANADIQEVGFDVDLRKVVQADRGELMSYCSLNGVPDWISPFTYKALADTGLDSSKFLSKTATADGAAQVILSGWAARDGSGGGLDPAYQVVSGDEPPVSLDDGTHCLRFSGSNGTSDFCFPLSFLNSETLEDTEREYFAFKAPMPAGTNRVALISRTNGDVELAAVSSASGAPSLTITSPVAGDRWDGGTRTIAWTASDPDGARVTSSVLYSADGGGTWLPLALDLRDSRYTFEIARLQGGRDVRFRVMASSGLSSTTVEVGPIEIVERPTIVSSTAQLDFLTQAVGQDVEQTFTITNSGSGTLVLNSARSDNGAFTVSRPAMPMIVPGGSAAKIAVRWRVASTEAQTGTLTIASNDASRPSITIALRGKASSAAAAPLIAVNPSTLDFGSLAAGQSKTLDLVVSNNGSGPLALKSVSASGTRFTVLSSGLPAVLPALANLTIQVRFQPTAALASTESLTINSDDPRQPNLAVPLRGTGTTGSTPVLEVRAGNPSTVVTAWDFGTLSTTAPATSVLLQVINKTSSTISVATAIINSKFTLGAPAASAFTIASGAFENAQIFFRPTDNTVQTGSVTFTANGQSVTISLRGTGNVGGDAATSSILAVDGGTFTLSGGYGQGGITGYFINRLTPPSYPATLRSVLVYFPTRQLPTGTGVSILAAPNAGGTGGLQLSGFNFQRTAHTISALDSFTEIPVAPITINSGDFVVGFSAVNPVNVYPAVIDVASGSKQRSYIGSDGVKFALIDTTPLGPGNFGIRAKIDTGGTVTPIPVLAASLTSLDFGSVAVNGAAQRQLTISNTGAATATVTLTASGGFTVAPAGVSILAGGSAGVQVTFNPTNATPPTQTGVLAIAAPGAASVTVALTGSIATDAGGSCVAAPANQVSWFSGDGSPNDLVGGNNGSLQGGTTYAAGEVGQAFQFNGTTGYVQLGNPTNLRLTTGISIEAWINPRSLGSASQTLASIVTKWSQVFSDTADSDSYGLWLIANGGTLNLFSALHQAGARESTIQGGNISLNAWTHVAMTFDAATGVYLLYVNGQQVASLTSVGNIFPTNHNVLIGREDSYQVRAFNGLIDEVGIFSRALSAAEVRSIFGGGTAGKCKAGR